jgi:hypothetical protein
LSAANEANEKNSGNQRIPPAVRKRLAFRMLPVLSQYNSPAEDLGTITDGMLDGCQER